MKILAFLMTSIFGVFGVFTGNAWWIILTLFGVAFAFWLALEEGDRGEPPLYADPPGDDPDPVYNDHHDLLFRREDS